MPGRNTTTGTLPTKTVLENERFGGDDRAAVGGPAADGIAGWRGWPGAGAGLDWDAGTSWATDSWRSCLHGPSVTSGFWDDLLHNESESVNGFPGAKAGSSGVSDLGALLSTIRP